MANPMSVRVHEYRRRRELGGRGRSGRYARNQVWVRARQFGREFWWALLLVPGGFVLVFMPLALMLHGVARGAVIGGAGVSGLWLDVLVALVWTGSASKLMGASGEASTAEALRSLRRHGWRLVNGLKLSSRWDIDHVAVGPGGVIVVETKWSGDPWPLNGYGSQFLNATMDNAAVQAARNAKDLADWLATAGAAVPVISVVVLWTGAAESGTGWNIWRNGHTVIVHGAELRQWLKSELPQAGLPADMRELVWSLLDERVKKQDRADAEADLPVAVPPTLWGLAKRWMIKPLIGVLAGAYAIWGTIRWAHDWRIALAGTVLAVVVGFWATQFASVRQLALGWIAICSAMIILEIVVLIDVAAR